MRRWSKPAPQPQSPQRTLFGADWDLSLVATALRLEVMRAVKAAGQPGLTREELLAELRVRLESLDKALRELSGEQMVVLVEGRWRVGDT